MKIVTYDRYCKAKERALRQLNAASISARLGSYAGNLVHNAELAAKQGKPWAGVNYVRLVRIHQLEQRVNRIGNLYWK